MAAILTEAWGRLIAAIDMDPDDYARMLAARGLPPFAVEAIVGLRRAVGAGEYAAVSGDAARLAGRPVEPLGAYLRRASDKRADLGPRGSAHT